MVVPPEKTPAGIARLEGLGYEHEGDLGIPGREAFRAPADLPCHHLYLCHEGGSALANHLAVRDYLRQHPEAAREYGELKRDLAARFPHDIDRYIAGKSAFLLHILESAGLETATLDEIAALARPLLGSSPALIVVDVQEAAVAEQPFEVDRVLRNIAALLAAARKSGTPIIFVQHDGRAGESTEPGTAGWEIHAGVAPEPGEPVVRKRFNSAFRETRLHSDLQTRGADTLVIVGIQTEYCVDTTVRVAFELGYAVVVPSVVPIEDVVRALDSVRGPLH